MKNTLQILSFVIIAIFSSINYSSAQSLELISSENAVQGVPEKSYKSHAVVKNITTMDKVVFVRVTPIKLTSGHFFSICIPENCLPETTTAFDSPEFTLKASATLSDDFYLSLNPVDVDTEVETEGESTLKIDFIVANNETDFVTYTTTFLMSKASVIETWNRTADVFPNPSTEHVIIRLKEELPTTSIINIYDANGNVKHQEELRPNTSIANIGTSSWNAGSYYFTIESNGNILNSGSFTVLR